MTQSEIVALNGQALDLIERGNLSGARILYEQICILDAQHAEARMMLGVIKAKAGDPAKAETFLRQALAIRPTYPEALYYLGNILQIRGQTAEAVTCFERAVELKPDYAEAWVLLGRIRAQQKQYAEAERCCREAIHLNPMLAEAQMVLGYALQEQKRLSEAEKAYASVLKINPGNSSAGLYLGNVLRAQGKTADAISAYSEASKRETTNAGIHYQLGCALQELGQFDESANCYRDALRLKPDMAEAYVRLAFVLQAKSNYQEALTHCQQALRIKPDLAEAHHVLAVSLVALDRGNEAILSFEQALHFKPDYVDSCIGLASVLLTAGAPEEARTYCEKALQLNPTNIDAIALAAYIAIRMGEMEKAFRLLSPLVERGVQQVNIAVTFAMISKDLGRQSEAIALIENTLRSDPALSDSSRISLHFNLGMLYDNTEQYDQAFSRYRQGNNLKPLSFDRTEYARYIEKHKVIHSPDFMERMPRARVVSDRPVFIVGMVRSGTSLVEQILSSHPDVFGAGELPDITQITKALPGLLGTNLVYPECLPQLAPEHLDTLAQGYLDRLARISPNAKRVTDKLPGNFMYLGLIELLFPGARVIHCLRDPVDTCLSAYFQDFSSHHPYAYDLSNLSAFYRGYLKLMAHWRKILRLPLLEIRYEDLVANQEQVSRSLVEFCGLDWDDSCLRFHETRRLVSTASHDQVKRPLYQHSVARWRHYERHLEPLIAGLKE